MHTIALIDCNNFFVSCERLFRPDLAHKPVLVLSSNDGCVVSRSEEVKILGIKMGEPYFRVKTVCEKNGVAVFSSNFDLYRDLSHRVMHTLRGFSDTVEVYSVDEAFVVPPTHGTESDLQEWASTVRRTVLTDIGISVSVGVSHTKTLAKVATHLAKQRARSQVVELTQQKGVEVLLDQASINAALTLTPIGEVWGIGFRQAPMLMRLGVRTAYDLTRMSDMWVRERMSVCGLRTVHELRGVSCFDVGEHATLRKSLLHSQSFAHTVQDFATVHGAVVYHARKVAEILRAEGAITREVGVLIRTSRHGSHERYAAFESDMLLLHTNDTLTLTTAVCAILARIYKPGFPYAKAGVLVRDILPQGATPSHTFFGEREDARMPLMRTIDTLRHRYGDIIHIASEKNKKDDWHARRQRISRGYTTSWDELATVAVRMN
jgi:DNA polymerase V